MSVNISLQGTKRKETPREIYQKQKRIYFPTLYGVLR